MEYPALFTGVDVKATDVTRWRLFVFGPVEDGRSYYDRVCDSATMVGAEITLYLDLSTGRPRPTVRSTLPASPNAGSG